MLHGGDRAFHVLYLVSPSGIQKCTTSHSLPPSPNLCRQGAALECSQDSGSNPPLLASLPHWGMHTTMWEQKQGLILSPHIRKVTHPHLLVLPPTTCSLPLHAQQHPPPFPNSPAHHCHCPCCPPLVQGAIGSRAGTAFFQLGTAEVGVSSSSLTNPLGVLCKHGEGEPTHSCCT